MRPTTAVTGLPPPDFVDSAAGPPSRDGAELRVLSSECARRGSDQYDPPPSSGGADHTHAHPSAGMLLTPLRMI